MPERDAKSKRFDRCPSIERADHDRYRVSESQLEQTFGARALIDLAIVSCGCWPLASEHQGSF
jgi:hypothetical protein